MIEKAIEKIKEQIQEQGYKKYSNEWNIANQLIDIVAIDQTSAEIVLQDLSIEEMSVKTAVKKIVGIRLTNPEDAMRELCNFYKIQCPDILPPEHWRTCEPGRQGTGFTGEISLMDLI